MTRLYRLPGKPKRQDYTGRPARAVLDELKAEAAFQAEIERAAALKGWLTWHDRDSRKNERGLPDLVMVYPGDAATPGRLVFAELKREGEEPTEEQRQWLAALATVPGITVRLWRPSDFDEIERVLTRRGEQR